MSTASTVKRCSPRHGTPAGRPGTDARSSTLRQHTHTTVTRALPPDTDDQENTVSTAHLSHELARERCRELLDQATLDRLSGLALATRTGDDRSPRRLRLRLHGRRGRPARGPVPTG